MIRLAAPSPTSGRRWSVAALGLACAQACLACSGPPPWPGGDDVETEEPGPVEHTTTDVEVTGTIVEPGNDPVEGLEVCVFGDASKPCATTDRKGTFVMRAPPRKRLMLSFEGRDEFPPAVATYETTTSDGAFEVLIFPLALLPMLDDAIGQKIDLGLGHVLLEAHSALNEAAPNVSGVTAAIDPATGLGPYYQADLLPDVSLTETGAAGGIGFVNLTTGSYDVALHHPVRTCDPWVAWPSNEAGSVRLEVVEGYVTLASVVCQ